MKTLDQIKAHGESIIDKIKRGETVSAKERLIIKIYLSLFTGKAGNAGKRKIIKTGR